MAAIENKQLVMELQRAAETGGVRVATSDTYLSVGSTVLYCPHCAKFYEVKGNLLGAMACECGSDDVHVVELRRYNDVGPISLGAEKAIVERLDRIAEGFKQVTDAHDLRANKLAGAVMDMAKDIEDLKSCLGRGGDPAKPAVKMPDAFANAFKEHVDKQLEGANIGKCIEETPCQQLKFGGAMGGKGQPVVDGRHSPLQGEASREKAKGKVMQRRDRIKALLECSREGLTLHEIMITLDLQVCSESVRQDLIDMEGRGVLVSLHSGASGRERRYKIAEKTKEAST